MKIQGSIDMFLPAVVLVLPDPSITAQRELSFISEDFFVVVCGIFPGCHF